MHNLKPIKFHGRRAVAIGLFTAMLHLTAMVPLASSPEGEIFSGRVRIGGQVTIDDVPTVLSQTIFSGTRIVTAHKSQSTIYLGSESRLDLHPESALFLEFSNSDISATLTNGKLSAFVPLGVSTIIRTNDAAIVIDSCESAVFSIHVTPDGTNVTVETGRVEVVSRNTRTSVKGGERLLSGSDQLLVTGAPQALDDNKLGWVIGGIGAAIGVVLVAIAGRPREEALDFGGCVTVSGNTDPPPVCP